MNKALIVVLLIFTIGFSQTKIVRVYADAWQDLTRIDEKYNIDIAAARNGEWYDIVADQPMMNKILASGLPYEITVQSIEYQKEQVRGEYHSYDQVNQILRNLATTYPSICKLDSLPIRTYQGRWLYGVKISDNPSIEEDNEPGFVIDALHHAREWATIEVVLFFADSICRAYASVPEIAAIVNNVELYCFPIINGDGFVYDYPGQNMWRKNREPFGGATGTDPNRNYQGCGPDIAGNWGAVDEGQATHYPSNDVFCGAYANSGDETRALQSYIRSHTTHVNMTYHSYSELVMWGWGWTTSPYPEGTVHTRIGTRIAGMINKLGSGTYDPGQIPVILYSVSGGSLDWVYSYQHWVNGVANLSYTSEVGTAFYQNTSQLDPICRENFKALKYLAQFARDSLQNVCEPIVGVPSINPVGTVNANFTITWHPRHPNESHPTRWELVELSNPSIITDNLEGGTGRWTLNGFTLSTAQSHSPTHSFFSGNSNNQNTAVTTIHPFLVQAGDSVTFWCRYTLENNYDVAVVEVSENTKEWYNLDTTRFTSTQSSWVRRAYSLANWVGKSIYIRFRSMYDSGTTSGGFYVDDIYPVCQFANVTAVSSNITDTLYQFTNHPLGEFYYYVRGDNAAWDWGDYSILEKVNVIVGIAEQPLEDQIHETSLRISPNPFTTQTAIHYALSIKHYEETDNTVTIKIYDATGRIAKNLLLPTAYSLLSGVVTWNGTDNSNQKLPSGVYFVELKDNNTTLTEKILLSR
ncbi:hypothetical protein A2Y85_01125 [candidate division WOR-3 bacterium RBG_13_43_14]|uniref:carboxypeptidase T n=1 Tax=candidate division WOR-3 bacterium RBG_13_43_14 TaxID=1802590 RepID=A0A1F4UFT7_UNCW3|nr:MAG: hypothetical protein A2Y85_01125 [candidate division WOR-3 bacterium RBG_13_43_14]